MGIPIDQVKGPMMSIGLKGETYPKLVCENLRQNEDGSLSFYVINGAWSGTFLPTGQIRIDDETVGDEYVIQWHGYTGKDYNEAILWIEEQITEGITYSPKPPSPPEDDLDDEIPF